MQNIKFTKSHVEVIAHMIRTLPLDAVNSVNLLDQRIAIAEHFADRMASTNPNFKRERFIEWCTTRPLNKFSTFIK